MLPIHGSRARKERVMEHSGEGYADSGVRQNRTAREKRKELLEQLAKSGFRKKE